jgi:hypothetical protein
MVERSQILGSQLPLTAIDSIKNDPLKPSTVVKKKEKKRLGG